MTRDQPHDSVGETHARALHHVESASAERSRLKAEHERAKGTSGEMQADVSLRAADDEVAARERWLQWVEERDD